MTLSLLAAISGLLLGVEPGPASDPEFFEKSVRPLLASRCLGCHGPEKQEGELRLDSREAGLAGGSSGPAVVPGKADESPIIQAIRYDDVNKMPPKSKLPDEEIAVLTRWVAEGAAWPEAGPKAAATVAKGGFDLRERSKFWSFQPVRAVEPPAVRRGDWPTTPVDNFLLAALEAKGLSPAGDAEKRTLIRRVSFDLIGLPPTSAEVDAFLADATPGAFATVVDRLLASPHYGERWGRHWLDVVRFAETSGHEFDYEIPDAYRYRDYIVRAFNADVPFDDFIVEHIAGDLLEMPRRNSSDGSNESVVGTAFFALGDGSHSPVDLREEEMRRADNQVDVLSKAFLGLTVACARCHDHKFDPISTADYYALAGYLKSSRFQLAILDDSGRDREAIAELRRIKARELERLGRLDPPTDVAKLLLAAEATLAGPGDKVGEVARARGVDEAALRRWVAAIKEPAATEPGHALFAWNRAAGRVRDAKPSEADRSILFEGFGGNTFGDWSATGPAFGDGPSRGRQIRLAAADGPGEPSIVRPGVAHSGLVSDRLAGVLRSPSFTIERNFIQYRLAGHLGRVRLVVDGFQKIRDPIYGGLTFAVEGGGDLHWVAQDVSMWIGHRAYIELADGAVADYDVGPGSPLSERGFLAVDEVRFSDRRAVPTANNRFATTALAGGGSLEIVAERYEAVLRDLGARWGSDANGLDADRAGFLAYFTDRSIVPLGRTPEPDLKRHREVEATIRPPTLSPALVDGTAEDESILIRGNPKTPGKVVPRRFLEALGGRSESEAVGSARLGLASRIAAPTNPLTARVLVNRLWKHHFGEGLVKSIDDFGVMGQAPSHPDLLEYLAGRFVAEGWSIKRMHRLILLSHAYRMSSAPDRAAEVADPDNRLLHRMNVHRLDAEAIRDAILMASGRLDPALFGPSVAPHLTPFMEGRGRPARSGPLDGDGRRSLYINVRRNFLTPMLLAFDFPTPSTTIGRRSVSNVPAQSLTLLNDPFVLAEARRWAATTLARPGLSAPARVDLLYETAFGRPPTESERSRALDFVRDEADAPGAWADLCHVLFNAKEFLYIY